MLMFDIVPLKGLLTRSYPSYRTEAEGSLGDKVNTTDVLYSFAYSYADCLCVFIVIERVRNLLLFEQLSTYRRQKSRFQSQNSTSKVMTSLARFGSTQCVLWAP